MVTYVETHDVTKPAGTRDLSLGDDDIREYKRAIDERLNEDHVKPSDETGYTTVGYHRKCTLIKQASNPTAVDDTGIVYVKDAGSDAMELYYIDDDSNVVQITKLGYLRLDSARLSNATYLIARNAADSANVNMLRLTTGNLLEIMDGAVMASSAAPTVDAGIANKKYVDDKRTIVQVVNTQTGAMSTGSTAIPDDDTIPQSSEGDEYMTLAITPTKTTNKLLIEVVVMGHCSASDYLGVALFQDSTADALAAIQTIINPRNSASFKHYMTAGTTSATTFKVRCGAASGTFTLNGASGARRYGGVMASSITITEITV